MAEHRLHLWAHVPGGLIPSLEIDADSEEQAAAIALLHFKRQGYDTSDSLAHIDVGPIEGPFSSHLVADIIAWVRKPAQAKFVAAEGLDSLL